MRGILQLKPPQFAVNVKPSLFLLSARFEQPKKIVVAKINIIVVSLIFVCA